MEKDFRIPLFSRCLAGVLAFFAVSKTVSMIPLTLFQVISQLCPFFSGLLAFLWLGEKLAAFQIVAMVISFGGIAIVSFSGDAPEESGITEDKS